MEQHPTAAAATNPPHSYNPRSTPKQHKPTNPFLGVPSISNKFRYLSSTHPPIQPPSPPTLGNNAYARLESLTVQFLSLILSVSRPQSATRKIPTASGTPRTTLHLLIFKSRLRGSIQYALHFDIWRTAPTGEHRHLNRERIFPYSSTANFDADADEYEHGSSACMECCWTFSATGRV